jgi:hypothetical protein
MAPSLLDALVVPGIVAIPPLDEFGIVITVAYEPIATCMAIITMRRMSGESFA